MTKLPDQLEGLVLALTIRYAAGEGQEKYLSHDLLDFALACYIVGWQGGATAMKEMMRIKGDAQNNWAVDRIPLPVPE